MIIELTDVNGEIYCADNVTQFNFTQSADAACDSFWACYRSDDAGYEIKAVRVYKNGRLIFNGLCDEQRMSESEKGFEIYFYARSTACVLVDNEAKPFTYICPTAKQIYFCVAEKYGFTCSLPELSINGKYEVARGTSCYGALSRFVNLLIGEKIIITPENDIRLMKRSGDIKNLNKYRVLSAAQTIKRSAPYSQIIFKRNASEPEYSVHTKALLSDELGICRSAYINLSSLAQWQRESTVLRRLKASYDDYLTMEVRVCGYVGEELMQRFSYRSERCAYDDYVLIEKKYICSENGESTRLVLRKNKELEEITYVD